jgi:hypothetical protein
MKYIELAKKLKELADKGIDGERQNASEMLTKFMLKHNINLEDIEAETKKHRRFYTENKAENDILEAVVTRVLNTYEVNFYENRDKRTKQFIQVELTDSEFIETEFMFNFYKDIFNKEFTDFCLAFRLSQKLFPQNQGNTQIKEQTPEQRQRNRKLASMMQSIDHKTPTKQLNQA